MGQNKLVPVIRPDINGKLVTRHVIADKGTGSRVTIPAPAGTHQVLGVKEYARRIAEALAPEGSDSHAYQRTLTDIFQQEMGLESLKELHDRLPRLTTDEKLVLSKQSMTLFNNLTLDYADGEQTEKMFHNILESLDIIEAFSDAHYGNAVYKASRRVMEQTDEMGMNSLSSSSSEWQRNVCRFLMFSQLIGDNRRMDHEELSDKVWWFAESTERLFPHAARILANDRVDWDWMKELANPDTATGLSEGTL
jgi:hypothetical protein